MACPHFGNPWSYRFKEAVGTISVLEKYIKEHVPFKNTLYLVHQTDF